MKLVDDRFLALDLGWLDFRGEERHDCLRENEGDAERDTDRDGHMLQPDRDLVPRSDDVGQEYDSRRRRTRCDRERHLADTDADRPAGRLAEHLVTVDALGHDDRVVDEHADRA